jgi:Ca2+-binding EF-hand superfamily protein
MEKVFEGFDQDKDGKITIDELKSMLTELKLRTSIGTGSIQSDKEDAQTLMDALDEDNSGTVEKAEFVEWIVRGVGRPLRQRVQWANKSVRNRRLDHFLRAVTETASGTPQRSAFRRQLRTVFLECDLDSDGHIVVDELVAMMTEIRLAMGIGNEDVRYAKEDAAAVIQAMDSDGNGRIEEDEFVNWMNDGLSIPMSRRESFAARSDFNRRTTSFLGSVEAYIKRVLLLVPENQAMIRMRLRKVFRRFDQDGDGNIQSDEAQTMVNEMLNVGPQNEDPIFKHAGTKMISALDYTGDGEVDEDEFVQWVTTGMTRTSEERAIFAARGPVNVLLLRLVSVMSVLFFFSFVAMISC